MSRKTPDSAVIAWLVRHDAELALPTVTIAEIAFGIRKTPPDQRAIPLEEGLSVDGLPTASSGSPTRRRLPYGDIMGAAARQGHGMSAPDGMIAAIARVNDARLATRNLGDFATTGLDLISPWNF
jgi:predicted nucleic acid-binding protein